jgi:hypothetical protein
MTKGTAACTMVSHVYDQGHCSVQYGIVSFYSTPLHCFSNIYVKELFICLQMKSYCSLFSLAIEQQGSMFLE